MPTLSAILDIHVFKNLVCDSLKLSVEYREMDYIKKQNMKISFQ